MTTIKHTRTHTLWALQPSFRQLLLTSTLNEHRQIYGAAIKKWINKNAIRGGVKNADISEAQNKIFDFPSDSYWEQAFANYLRKGDLGMGALKACCQLCIYPGMIF